MTDKIIGYEEARDNRELRQEYLNQHMNNFPEFFQSVNKLIYDNGPKINSYINYLASEGYLDKEEVDKSKQINNEFYFLVIFPPKLLGLKQKNPIFVFDNGFKFKSEGKFLNSLVDHEAVHSDQLYSGIRLNNNIVVDCNNVDRFNPKTIINIREIQAYTHQLNKLKDRKIEDSYFEEWIKYQLMGYREQLYAHLLCSKNEFERHAFGFG